MKFEIITKSNENTKILLNALITGGSHLFIGSVHAQIIVRPDWVSNRINHIKILQIIDSHIETTIKNHIKFKVVVVLEIIDKI